MANNVSLNYDMMKNLKKLSLITIFYCYLEAQKSEMGKKNRVSKRFR